MKYSIKRFALLYVLLFTSMLFLNIFTINTLAATGTVTIVRKLEDGTVIDTEVINKNVGNGYSSSPSKGGKVQYEDGKISNWEKDGVRYIYSMMPEDSAPANGTVKEEAQTVTYIYSRYDDARTITVHRNLPSDYSGYNDTVVVKLPKTAPMKGVWAFTNVKDGSKLYKDPEWDIYKNSADWYWYFFDNFYLLPEAEKQKYKKADGKYDQNKYAENLSSSWNGRGSGFWDMLRGRVLRTYAYNTKPDGSGTYYKTGVPFPEDAPDNLELYVMSTTPMHMASLFSEVQKVKPVIYLEQNPNYLTVPTAYNVDKSGSLHYKAKLDFSNIRDAMRVLWGRSDKMISWKGYVRPVLDRRLQFDREVQIAFESTWERLDPEKQAELGATNIRYEGNRTIFTFSTERMERFKNQDGDYEINIPVTLIPKRDFVKLSFEEFMKPMWLSVADNFEEGLNAIITDESYMSIATSPNPVIKVGGQINLEIMGDTGSYGGIKTYTNGDPKADDVYARLFPFGKLNVDFYEVKTGADGSLNEVQALTSPRNKKGDIEDSTQWTYRGRSKHARYENLDAQNYANSFYMTDSRDTIPTNLEAENIKEPVNITHPDIDGYTFVGMKDKNADGSKIAGFDTFDYTYGHDNIPADGVNVINPKLRRLYYIKNSSIIVRHITVDPDGNETEIADREYYSGNIGETYTTKYKENGIPYNGSVYKYIKTADYTAPVSGEYKDKVQTITYVYSLGGSVVARYVIEGTDTELLNSEAMPTAKVVKEENSNIGETYSIPNDSVDIPNLLYDAEGNAYKYSKDREDTKTFGNKPVSPRSGEVALEPKTVVFEYVPVYGDVIVHYVDEEGNTIYHDVVNTELTNVKKNGPSYNTLLDAYSSINYNGKVYKFKTVAPNDEDKQNGLLKEGRIEVTYIYTLDKDMDIDIHKTVSRADGSDEGERLLLKDEEEIFTYKISTPLPKELNAKDFEFKDRLSDALKLENIRIKFLATGSEASAVTPSPYSLNMTSNSEASPSEAEELSVYSDRSNIPKGEFLSLEELGDLVEANIIDLNDISLKITDKDFLDSIKGGSIVVAIDARVFYPNYHEDSLPNGIPNRASVKVNGNTHLSNIVYVKPFKSKTPKNTPNGGGGGGRSGGGGGGGVTPNPPRKNDNPVGPTVPNDNKPNEPGLNEPPKSNGEGGMSIKSGNPTDVNRDESNNVVRILKKVPKTGDNNNLVLLISIFGMALISIVFLFRRSKK